MIHFSACCVFSFAHAELNLKNSDGKRAKHNIAKQPKQANTAEVLLSFSFVVAFSTFSFDSMVSFPAALIQRCLNGFLYLFRNKKKIYFRCLRPELTINPVNVANHFPSSHRQGVLLSTRQVTFFPGKICGTFEVFASPASHSHVAHTARCRLAHRCTSLTTLMPLINISSTVLHVPCTLRASAWPDCVCSFSNS